MGRPKGSRNGTTVTWLRYQRDRKKLPVEFLLDQMENEENDLKTRIYCAATAAPYIHPKLTAISVSDDASDAAAEARSRPRTCGKH